MRVLWLAPYPLQELSESLLTNKPLPFGTCNWLVHLSRALANLDEIDLHILSFSNVISADQTFQQDGIHFHIVRYAFPLFSKGPSLFCFDRLTTYKTLRTSINRKVAEIQPDLIHAHGTEGAYSLAASENQIPAITSIQGIIHEIYRVEPSFGFKLQLPIERISLEKNQHFGCRTQWDSSLVRQFNPTAQIHYMPEAINPAYFKTGRQPADNPTVTFVGGLVERKGIGVLMQAIPEVIKHVPTVKFTIVGNGNQQYVNSLKNWAEQQGIAGCISWLGSQKAEKIAGILAKTAVYVLPTFMDNSPNSICEAMAMGVPVISTEIGGVPSIVDSEKTGLLVSANNVQQLAQAMIRVLTDQELAERLGNEARIVATQRHLPANVAATTLRAYQAVLQNYTSSVLTD